MSTEVAGRKTSRNDSESSDAPPGGAFRDASHGAEARRDYLLRKRRHDYAVLSHAIRRIFVRRVARTVASITAALGALMICAGALDAAFYAWLADFIPGPKPALLTTMLWGTWLEAIMVYFIARSLAEDFYARAISRTVQPTDDLYADLDRLERIRPEFVASRLANRMEFLSVASVLAGLSLLVPLTCVYLLVAMAQGDIHVPTEFDHDLVHAVPPMLPALGLCLALSIRGGRQLCANLRTPIAHVSWTRWPDAYFLTVLAVGLSFMVFDKNDETIATFLIALAVGGLWFLGWLVNLRVRREHTLLVSLSAHQRDV